MVPSPALITADHFVSAVRQAAHTINLETGCEWFAWLYNTFVEGEGVILLCPERTEGSEV